MKICAIICEYNPFHMGHLKHMQLAKEKSGADAILCIQTGNFSQRGEPTIVNKYVRAKMALENGADIVVQMPTPYACSSAEIFALAGVKIANSFSNVTHLAFGCECDNEKILNKLADFFINEPKEFSQSVKEFLKNGDSLVSAKEKALREYLKNNKTEFKNAEIDLALKAIICPNNILAIEYLKAIKQTKSNIKPVFISRTYNNFSSTELFGDETSATAIRALLYKKGKAKAVKKFLPKSSYDCIKEEMNVFGLPDLEIFNNLCMFSLKTSTTKDLKQIFDVNEGLENRIYEVCHNTKDLTDFLINVKTKRYTFSRIKRIVLNRLLNINKSIINEIYKMDKLPFIKVLGFKSENSELLKNCECNTNLIIRVNNVDKDKSKLYKEIANIEDNANQVYYLLLRKNKAIPNYTPDLLTKTIKI